MTTEPPLSTEVQVPENETSFGPIRLLISSLVLVGLLAAGYVYMFGVPEALLGSEEPTEAATGAESGDSADPGGSGVAAPAAMPVPVRTAIARRQPLVMRITATGNAESLRQLDIHAAASGVIEEVAVQEGDLVQEGDPLVRLDDAELTLAVQRNREQLVSAVARFQENLLFLNVDDLDEETLEDFESAQEDLLAGLQSPAQFEAMIDDQRFDILFETITRDEVMAAQEQLMGNYTNYAQAQLELERAQITAPFAGQVADLQAVVGQRVGSGGDPLMTLVDADPIRVRVDVLESDAGLVREGREARVLFAAYPERNFTGRIETISPIVDPEKKTLEVIVRLPNPDLSLKPGMFAQIVLDTEIFEDRLLVPASAVLLRDDRPMLFVVRDGRSEWIYIRQGLSNGEMIEVLEGIEPGDEVIVSGHYSLAHDAPVRVVEDEETLPNETR